MPWPRADGPDIAHYQEVTGEPVDPGWRLFSHKCSEGANSGDVTFQSRWAWMRTQGFRYRGAYHWLRSDSAVSAQVKNVVGRLSQQGGLRQGEFIQSDWETTPGIVVNSASHEREFCDRLEQHYGRACTITYSSDWIPDSPDDPDSIGEFYNWLNVTQGAAPLWFANYNTTPTNPQGGQQECARYGADVWQFTSSFRHPSIMSRSGSGEWDDPTRRGWDMNHVLNFATLDRIAGYRIPEPEPPPPDLEDDVKSVIYTVRSETDQSFVWMKVSDADQVRQVANGDEYQLLVAQGAVDTMPGPNGTKVPLEPTSTAHFRQMLQTYQPVGRLNATATAVLGGAAVGDWDARSYRNPQTGGGSAPAKPYQIQLTGSAIPGE